MVKKHDWFNSIWNVKCVDKEGKILWEEEGRNSLTDEGEEAILETFFRADTLYTPTQFYVRLCNDSLLETDTLITILNEPASVYGYSAQLVERSTTGFPTKELDSGDYRLISKDVTFTAVGGDIGPVITAFLATTSDNSGKLIAFKSLPVTRTITTGNSGIISIRIKMKPGN